jgi:hypothetical protein
MILPTSILIIFLVVGLFIFKKSQVAIKPKEVPKVEETKPITTKPPLAFPSVAEGKLKADEKPSKTLKSEIPVEVKKVVPRERGQVRGRESAGIVPKEVPKVEETETTIQEPSIIPALTVVQSETPVNSQSYAAAGKEFVAKIDPIDPVNEINKTNQMNQPFPPIKVELQTAESKDTPLIATEEDVKQFFANYIGRYTQKDLDGFLSLFSPKAVQNHQDGLKGIRKIYANFFDQSQEIQYTMNDVRIEIYQNGVEVQARYELVQMLKKSGEKKIWKGDIRWRLVKEDGTLKILFLDYQPQKSY